MLFSGFLADTNSQQLIRTVCGHIFFGDYLDDDSEEKTTP
jgi:hypothetical protein